MLVDYLFDEVPCIKPVLSVHGVPEVHFEEMYHIVGEVGRLQHPLLDEEPALVDVLAVYNSIGRFRVVIIKLVSVLVNFRTIIWFRLPDVPLFVKFPIFVHDDIVEQLVADVLLQLEQQLHFVGVALVDSLFVQGGVLPLEAQACAVVLVVCAVFLAGGPCKTAELKLDGALSQHGRYRTSLGGVPLP